jgi:hypothetical protein
MDIAKPNRKKPYISTERKIEMNTLGLLETLLVANMITAEEYKERKAVYVEALLELYCLGIITQEQMNEKLNN